MRLSSEGDMSSPSDERHVPYTLVAPRQKLNEVDFARHKGSSYNRQRKKKGLVIEAVVVQMWAHLPSPHSVSSSSKRDFARMCEARYFSICRMAPLRQVGPWLAEQRAMMWSPASAPRQGKAAGQLLRAAAATTPLLLPVCAKSERERERGRWDVMAGLLLVASPM
mmetsp:Transcript_26804/g.58286  ORF Transcript_26804/g.58286 Transcript_26804/m.58286 type:complete len:166 (+) Transcript_26804:70-567(+)|eukprot:CAMPEP_0206564666 /NCGR_PEP_ID=MMETSP0325_2-20121206/23593_1 /ASSEMBLY_ACC=CAM_ASM_000347 /TAXON_ID=2866 /ORGANISM="Crypthecodinium cohnii, Strain Seligo" /LENGTH=165 /DNA_ID=CAMNT_0054067337 /DNA_START=35 /DNA_END=532 /DNA_ORIENTATION=+